MFGQGIKALLSMEDDIEIVSPSASIEEAVQCIQSCQPDFVILNCDDP